MNEIRIMNGFVKYFLPNYGSSIENLILYGSLTINDNTVNYFKKKRRKYLNYYFILFLGKKNL